MSNTQKIAEAIMAAHEQLTVQECYDKGFHWEDWEDHAKAARKVILGQIK